MIHKLLLGYQISHTGTFMYRWLLDCSYPMWGESEKGSFYHLANVTISGTFYLSVLYEVFYKTEFILKNVFRYCIVENKKSITWPLHLSLHLFPLLSVYCSLTCISTCCHRTFCEIQFYSEHWTCLIRIVTILFIILFGNFVSFFIFMWIIELTCGFLKKMPVFNFL